MAVKNGGPGPDLINFRPLGLSNDVGRGEGGSDVLLGGNGNDRLYGGAENDSLFGDSGDDRLFGDSGDDELRGGAGDDRVVGGIGEDELFGGSDSDRLLGGEGRDVLEGGFGQDFLTGGPENAVRDDFVFEIGQSNSTNAQADTILDWISVDRIVSDVAGSAANYLEHSAAGGAVTVTDIESARADAETAHTNKTHVFFYDAGTDTGYLVSDLNNDNLFETGVVLNGAGAAGDFDWTNIIA